GLLCPAAARADTPDAKLGKKVRFALKDTAGKTWSSADLTGKKAVVVVFIGTQCPINNAYMPRLVELDKTFGPQGVQFLAINSNDHDSAETIKAHAKKHGLPFPVLRDEGHVAADRLGARRTPEAIVLDGRRVIHYQGRIDDRFGIGYQRPQPKRHDLAEAIKEGLAGKKVTQATTPVEGCLIARAPRPRESAAVTYSNQVARILQNKCQECHRPGQIGPMPLLSYEDSSSWAAMIREVVKSKRMPPWHADPAHGKFLNDRSLSKADSDTLLTWIENGCPKGDDKDMPEAKKFTDGWNIGKPDAVFTMPREFTVPAKSKGGVRYQYFVVPTNFEDDVWIQAAEAKPGNRAVVHHIIVYVAKDRKRMSSAGDGLGAGFLVAYAPGDLGVGFPLGAAKKIPKGANLVFQMHYTPNGFEQSDRSSVGLIFAKKPPEHEVRTRGIAQRFFVIPPGAKSHKVTSSTTFTQDAMLWSLLPHMHLRGRSFSYQAVFPDGKTQILLSVPQYDFNWQSNYRLEKPLHMPAGTKIECTATFDNSTGNANNPDPTRWVIWGDQTWEEMMIGFVDYTYLADADKK
ncbi:MAG TPA: redoxin domain-containing protein, partial [Gemmataceae bacterium]|nr:redoxin domain-containing protein [Gemmataceae bacterium]